MERIEESFRKENLRRVFRRVLDAGADGISVYDIHKQLRISYPAVHRYIRLLSRCGAIKKLKSVEGKTGVPKILYTVTVRGKEAYRNVIADLQKEIDEDLKAIAKEKAKMIPGLAAPDLLRRVLEEIENE